MEFCHIFSYRKEEHSISAAVNFECLFPEVHIISVVSQSIETASKINKQREVIALEQLTSHVEQAHTTTETVTRRIAAFDNSDLACD